MKIQYQSDLHIECFDEEITYQIPTTDADVIVLAGDIGDTSQKSVDWVLEATKNKPTVFCLGNHEGYDQCWQEAIAAWSSALKGSHVHLLNNNAIVLEGTQFIGSTLWTDYCLLGAHRQAEATLESANRMNDHRLIKFLEDGTVRRFQPSDALALHMESINYFRTTLKKPFEGKRVIVSHHAPSIRSIPVEYHEYVLCGAFASDVEAFIECYRPHAWIHGHLHSTFDYVVGDTRVVCNPRGYEGHELNEAFSPAMTMTI